MGYKENRDEALLLLGGGKPNFTQFPNNFFQVLMNDEGQPCADGVGHYTQAPASFWRFLFILWHELMWDRKGKDGRLCASFSVRQFGIRPNDALLWTTALVAAGLFTVKKGTLEDREASTYYYKPADIITWQGFYRGLMMAYGEWRACRDDKIPNHNQTYRSMKIWASMVKQRAQMETEMVRKAVS